MYQKRGDIRLQEMVNLGTMLDTRECVITLQTPADKEFRGQGSAAKNVKTTVWH